MAASGERSIASAATTAAATSSSAASYPTIRYCDAGPGIQLAYEVFGATSANASAPPVVLVMGLGSQMLGWPEPFCRELARKTRRRVVRFDNRDVGLSTHLNDKRVSVMKALMARDFSSAPYSLADMADDVAALIRHLAAAAAAEGASSANSAAAAVPAQAHVVGCSMGGMIVQELCLRHPSLVCSMTSLMSTPDVRVGPASEEAKGVLVSPPPRNRDEALERAVEIYGVIGSKGYPTPEATLRQVAAEAFDRSFDPAGAGRQLLAIWSSSPRTERLKKQGAVRCPVLVLHGVQDPLIGIEGGRATAAAISTAHLVEIEDMAHDLPQELWPQIIGHIARLVERANKKVAATAAIRAALPPAKL